MRKIICFIKKEIKFVAIFISMCVVAAAYVSGIAIDPKYNPIRYVPCFNTGYKFSNEKRAYCIEFSDEVHLISKESRQNETQIKCSENEEIYYNVEIYPDFSVMASEICQEIVLNPRGILCALFLLIQMYIIREVFNYLFIKFLQFLSSQYDSS